MRRLKKGDHVRIQTRSSPNPTTGTLTTKLEDAGVFQKELSFLGEKETEAGQVILLIVRFYLSEIGVQRQIQRQLGTDSIFNIKAWLGLEIHIVPFQPRHRGR